MSDSVILLRVREIVIEKYNVKTFVFERADHTRLNYEAGQFLTFLIRVQGREVRRSYSMSSAPGVDNFPAITIKRVPNGEISRFWLDHVKVGDMFESLLPSGRFVLEKDGDEQRDIVLIGAGSGITPLFSILKQVLVTKKETTVTLIYANRSEGHTLFWNDIRDWERRYSGRLEVIHVHSQPPDDWDGIRGRINNTRLEQLISKSLKYPADRAKFFICGPFELMRSVEITLHYMGFSSGQIRKEIFVIDKMPPPPPVSNPHTISLTFHGAHYRLLVPAHTTILDAALQAGIRLPYSCKGGRCASCAAMCIGGVLHMSVNEVLTDRDLADGWILTCSAYVDGDDVHVEVK
jgi:ring-1,2-phenylacetyl-CoA epoxidase subunit PaaE